MSVSHSAPLQGIIIISLRLIEQQRMVHSAKAVFACINAQGFVKAQMKGIGFGNTVVRDTQGEGHFASIIVFLRGIIGGAQCNGIREHARTRGLPNEVAVYVRDVGVADEKAGL